MRLSKKSSVLWLLLSPNIATTEGRLGIWTRRSGGAYPNLQSVMPTHQLLLLVVELLGSAYLGGRPNLQLCGS